MQYAPDVAVTAGGSHPQPDSPGGSQPVRSNNMHGIHGSAQHAESVRTAIVLIAAVLVIFWRHVLRVLLAIIAIAVVALVGSGAIVILQSMHR
jgi:hypothetical protein